MELAPIQVIGLSWVKGPARAKDGEIVLDKDRSEEYDFLTPEASERMAFELASLPWHRRDEREVERFVKKYGLLSHGAEEVKRGECRESLADWWREATMLSFVGAFYQTLMDSKKDESSKKVQGFLRQYGHGFPYLRPEAEDFDQAYMAEASIMLANLINMGLHGRQSGKRCEWGLNAIGPGVFRLTQHPPDLISRAYAAFAGLIATNVETRFCPVCGKQFRPKPRQGECCGPAHQSTYRGWRRAGKV